MCETHTYAVTSGAVQEKASFADAFEASIIVKADSIQTDVPNLTLIGICTHTDTEISSPAGNQGNTDAGRGFSIA